MKHAAFGRNRSGAGMVEYIVVATLIGIGVIAMLTALGRRIARRYAAADASLDEGTPLRRAPVRFEPRKDGWRVLDHTENSGKLDFWTDVDPDRDPNGPWYQDRAREFAGADEVLYGGHHLGNMTGEWNPSDLLNLLTQFDAFNAKGSRCAPTCTVAAAAMGGAEGFQRLTHELRERIRKGITSENPEQSLKRESSVAALDRILERLETGSTTRKDMAVVDELLAWYYQPDPLGGASGEAATEMLGLGARSTRPAGSLPTNGDEFRTWVRNELKPGEVVRSSVDTTGDTDGMNKNQHAVLVGKDPEGREYLYDPFPKQAGRSQIVYRDSDPAQYDYYLEQMVQYHDVSGTHSGQVVGRRIYQY